MRTIFVTGIDTDAGKTIVSAIICHALSADYWKPVQSGTDEGGDSERLRSLLPDHQGLFHPESIRLKAPLSPHAAAELEGRRISLRDIVRPQTKSNMVIEGAGGLLVPLNDREVVGDLLQPEDKVVLVSRHYLGSINHTLLSVNWLNRRGVRPGILFNGEANPATEEVIQSMAEADIIGRIGTIDVSSRGIEEEAKRLKDRLEEWLES